MKNDSLLCIVSFCILTFGVNSLSYAFKPTTSEGHKGITEESLINISVVPTTTPNVTIFSFSNKALKEITDANANVDISGFFFEPTRHCDNEELPECTALLGKLKEDIILSIISNKPRAGRNGRLLLGRALHTLQDFYAHSNWIELNGANPANLGNITFPKPGVLEQTCDLGTRGILTSNFDASTINGKLTTSYFSPLRAVGQIDLDPALKCIHGGDNFSDPGINKDHPNRFNHTIARDAAVASTTLFVEDILNDPRVKGNDLAVVTLMDAAINGISGLTLGFVVDDTSSMAQEIQGVRTSIAAITNSISTNFNTFILQTFGDPSVGTPFITSDPTSLLSKVNSIAVSGGGDCPELSQAGLLSAIAAINPTKSQLYVYTDASAKDSLDKGKVASAANKKNISINYALTGSCSPIDPAYIEVAQRTGGQVFDLAPLEIDKLFSLIKPTLTGDLEPLLLINDSFSGNNKNYTFPVDSTISSLILSFTTTSNIEVLPTRPSGQVVNGSDIDTTFTFLTGTFIIQVDNPQQGDWQLDLTHLRDL